MGKVGTVVDSIGRRRLIYTNAVYFKSVAELAMFLINFRGSPVRADVATAFEESLIAPQKEVASAFVGIMTIKDAGLSLDSEAISTTAAVQHQQHCSRLKAAANDMAARAINFSQRAARVMAKSPHMETNEAVVRLFSDIRDMASAATKCANQVHKVLEKDAKIFLSLSEDAVKIQCFRKYLRWLTAADVSRPTLR